MKPLSAFLCLGAFVAPALVLCAEAQAPVSFHRDVRPILGRRCAGCHSSVERSAKLSVTSYAALKSGGTLGPSFVSGKPADSPLYKTISGKNPSMPKGGPALAAREVETIRLWIQQGGRDDTPVLNDPISAERPPVYSKPPVLTALAYSPAGDQLAVSGYREILLHRTDGMGGGPEGRLVGRSERIESLAYSPDGKLLAAVGGTSCKFGEVQIWDVATRKPVKTVEVGFDVLYGVSFSPDGKLLACGSAEKSAYVFSVPDLQQVVKFDNHSDWVFGTTFSRDGKNFISTSRDRAIKLIEIATKNFVDDINYQVYKGGYYAIARHPLQDEVAVGGDEGLIRHYSIFKKAARNINRDDFNLIRTFPALPGPLYALAFSPDGTYVAAGGRPAEVAVYRTADGGKAASLKGFDGSVHGLAFHPKNGQLAVAGFDGKVYVFAVPGGELVRSFVPVPMAPKAATR
jgi:WD40 repeat protein